MSGVNGNVKGSPPPPPSAGSMNPAVPVARSTARRAQVAVVPFCAPGAAGLIPVRAQTQGVS